jgi:MSHA biogenesis protein MshL
MHSNSSFAGNLRHSNNFGLGRLSAVSKAVSLIVATGVLSGCVTLEQLTKTGDVTQEIKGVLTPVNSPSVKSQPKSTLMAEHSVSQPSVAPPTLPKPIPEQKIDLLVNGGQARDVFQAIVADTKYSMLIRPDVTGTLSVTLRDVTVVEALESIRDVYGYDFKIDGRRITIFAPTIQTRIFTVNYPNSQRAGVSDLRVSSGAGLKGSSGASESGQSASTNDTSKVSTTSKTDLWSEMADAVKGIIGTGDGRSVVSSPQAGIIVVRAMPDELRQVNLFLKAAQVSIGRQVMLEAKIVEVELRDGFQSGVNWGAFHSGTDFSAVGGVLGSGVTTTNALLQSGSTTIGGVVPVPSVAAGGGLFGLALATSQFGAVLGFLESQGDVQTLSSPRLATLNNQKAVLKVGTDSFYVTNVSGGTQAAATTTTSASTSMPNITLTPFFSGISLDVTPQVDSGDNVTLHVHPAITSVNENSKQIDLGSIGNYKLPLASSNVNETDTLVRIEDGSIVAIGGLMQMESMRNSSGLPGASSLGNWSALFGNKASSGRKREVIVLIKPTIIRSSSEWEQLNKRSLASLDEMNDARVRQVKVDGNSTQTNPQIPQISPLQ